MSKKMYEKEYKKEYKKNPLALALMSFTATLLSAHQSVAQTENQETSGIEEIVVTGSRIHRNPLNEPAPVVELSETDLDRTGLTNFGAILQQLPSTGSAINTKFNVPGNSGFPPDGSGIGAGAVQVSLRNLGAKRTLVLVDGKRWVAGASASGVPNSVDLNTLPANIIQRVEVLQDGASAIYGSDAIGGVVNIITNSNFDGFKFSAQTGNYLSEKDGDASEYSALWGGGNDTTHFVFSASYTEEKSIQTADRKQSAFPTAFATSCEAGGCSSFTPQGRFILGPVFDNANLALNKGVLNDGTGTIPVFDPNNPDNDDFHNFTDVDRFNFNGPGYNFLQTPNERVNLYTQITQDISDTLRFSGKAAYTNRQSTTMGAPEPLCFGNGCSNPLMEDIVIDGDQRYNPFGRDLSVADGTLEFFGRRPLEAGPRIFEQDINTYFVSAGFEGEFTVNERNYYWDLTASYGDNRGTQQKTGAFNGAKLAVALGDPSVCEATPNCVPFNLFGGQGPDGTGSITQEMLDFVTYTQHDSSEQSLIDYTGNITGEILALPAGPLAFASGFEYRKHDGSYTADPIAENGETAGIPAGSTDGSFDVTEFYGEVSVPLLAGVSGADYLELSLAARSSDYSTIGTESTYKVGLLYRPYADLSVRGSVSTGIRAPGIGELFGGQAREDFEFTDPCSDASAIVGSDNGGRDTPQPQNIIDNCAALDVPEDMVQPNPQLGAVSSGNQSLKAETSDNYTLGFVYSPSWVDKYNWIEALTLSLDYYALEVDDAIEVRDAGDIITACIDTLDPLYCSSVERSDSGVINLVRRTVQNIGGIEASGTDIAVNYSAPETDLGHFGLRVNASHLDDYTELTLTPDGSNAENDLTGTITAQTFQRAFPEWRMTTNLDWNYEQWSAGLTLRYVDDMDQPSGEVLDSEIYTDLQVQYRQALRDSEMTLTFGANNVFDNEPSVCDACGSVNMSPVVHDLPGVVGYLRLTFTL